jgi:hypothetical protein
MERPDFSGLFLLQEGADRLPLKKPGHIPIYGSTVLRTGTAGNGAFKSAAAVVLTKD